MMCKQWSTTDARYFQGLCVIVVDAEAANDTKQCRVCVQPVSVPASASGSGLAPSGEVP